MALTPPPPPPSVTADESDEDLPPVDLTPRPGRARGPRVVVAHERARAPGEGGEALGALAALRATSDRARALVPGQTQLVV